MTEKRYIVADCSTCVFDKITEEEYVCIDREEAFLVCNRLNQLHEENTTLKQEIDNIYLLIGKGDWCGLIDLITVEEKQ